MNTKTTAILLVLGLGSALVTFLLLHKSGQEAPEGRESSAEQESRNPGHEVVTAQSNQVVRTKVPTKAVGNPEDAPSNRSRTGSAENGIAVPSEEELLGGDVLDLIRHPYFGLTDEQAGRAEVIGAFAVELKKMRDVRQAWRVQLNDGTSDAVHDLMGMGDLPGAKARQPGQLGSIISSSVATGWVGVPDEYQYKDLYSQKDRLDGWPSFAAPKIRDAVRNVVKKSN